jgi:DNA invertase Pin-like site-specific DNA recombinase
LTPILKPSKINDVEVSKYSTINKPKKEVFKMKIGYARVSTKKQKQKGSSLEDQINILKKEGCQKIYDEAFTGTKTDRPKFNKVLKELKEGDTLVVTKLDRFARTTVEGITTVRELLEKGIKVHILNMGLVEDTATGRLIFNIMSSFAEFERDMICERTSAGREIAREKEGYREGRPKKYNPKQVEHALNLLGSYSYKQVEAMTGISKSTLIRAKKERDNK